MATPDQTPHPIPPAPGPPIRTPSAPVDGLAQPFERGGLVALRAAVAAHGSHLGLAGGRLDDLLLIAHELASNAIQHGGGRGELRLWRIGDATYCQVADRGDGLADAASVGLHTPAIGALRGRGLWLVRQLADDVDVRSGSTGTTIVATIRLDNSHPPG